MEEGKQKKSRKTDDEAEIGQRQFNSDSVLGKTHFSRLFEPYPKGPVSSLIWPGGLQMMAGRPS